MATQYLSFSDCILEPDDVRGIIVGVPYDATASFRRGASLGPGAIRRASANQEDLDLRTRTLLSSIRVQDTGDSEEAFLPEHMGDNLAIHLAESLKPGIFPVLIGGEHSITPFLMRSLLASPDEGHHPGTIVILDAHTDMRESYLGEPNSHACATRRMVDLVGPGNVYVIGYRSVSEEEATSELFPKVRKWSSLESCGKLQDIAREIFDSTEGPIHLSLDIDALDPAYAPGTGTPEPYGLDPMEVSELIQLMAPRLSSFDILEVCPGLDSGQTALLAARYVREVFGWKALAEGWVEPLYM